CKSLAITCGSKQQNKQALIDHAERNPTTNWLTFFSAPWPTTPKATTPKTSPHTTPLKAISPKPTTPKATTFKDISEAVETLRGNELRHKMKELNLSNYATKPKMQERLLEYITQHKAERSM